MNKDKALEILRTAIDNAVTDLDGYLNKQGVPVPEVEDTKELLRVALNDSI